MSSTNIFAKMRTIKALVDESALRDESVLVFRKFCDFIEDYPFAKSESAVFILQNWRIKPKELMSLWEETGHASKIKQSFYNQTSFLSAQIHSIFPTFTVDAFSVCDSEVLLDISDTVDLINEGSDYSPSSYLLTEVTENYKGIKNSREYDISELTSEISAYKTLSKGNLFDLLDTLDSDKMVYIIRTMKRSLFSLKTDGICLSKLKLLRELGLLTNSDDVGFLLSTMQKSEESQTTETESTEPTVIVREEEYHNPYGLVLGKDATKKIESVMNRKATESEVASSGKDLETLRKLLQGYSDERLNAILQRVNPVDLATVLNELKQNKS